MITALKSRVVFLFVKAAGTSDCPVCGVALEMRGRRPRVYYDGGGQKRVLVIRRLKCCGCGRIHHELPDCVVPYKRHCAETIEGITADRTESTPCDERTKRRISAWWRVVLPYFLNILKSLAEKYKMTFSAPPAFCEIIRAAANSNHWTFPYSICTRSASLSE